MSMPLLDIRNLSVAYGDHQVLSAFNLQLNAGQVCAVLGEEGVGKTTLQKAITQQLRYTGDILFDGHSLKGVPTHQLAGLGIGYVLQRGNILKSFTVEETINIILRRYRKETRAEKWKTVEYFFPKLLNMRKQQAGRLSGGERMMLSLAGLAVMDARLVILDEPTAGLAPEVNIIIQSFVLQLTQKNISVLILEHNFDWVKLTTNLITHLT